MTVTNEVLDYSDKLRYLYANSIRNPVFFAENMLQVVVYKHNIEYINDLHRFILYRGGRKAGKSLSTAIKLVHYAYFGNYLLTKAEQRADVVVMAPSQQQTDPIMGHVKGLIKGSPFLAPRILKDNEDEIHLKYADGTGFARIMTRPIGTTGQSGRGYEPNVLAMDEIAFIPRKAVIATIPSGVATKTHIMLTSTPYGDAGYFYEKCVAAKAGNARCRGNGYDAPEGKWTQYYVPSTDNPDVANDQDYLDELKTLTHDEWETEVMGNFVSGGDMLFAREHLEKAFGDYTRPQKYRLYMGVDVARRGKDETVITVIAVDSKDRVYVEYCKSLKRSTIPETAREVERVYDMHSKLGGIDRIFYDSTALGAGAFDISQEVGLPVVEVVFTLQKKAKLYVNLVSLFEKANIKIGPNEKLMRQLGYMKKEYTQNHLKPQTEDHDDYPDSLALACMAVLSDEEFELIRDDKGKPMHMDQMFN